jgi:hypothetical protein
VFVPIILAICILSSCAVKTANVWGDPESGLILQYRMEEDQVLKYQSSSEHIQSFDLMGQSMEVKMNGANEFTVKSKGKKEANLQLEITIDSMEVRIDSPQGELSPDTSPVVGNSFDMILSPLGNELELIGAEHLKYTGPEGETSVSSDFQDIFPDTADRPVKIGDTWTSSSTISDTSGTNEIQLNFKSLNTLDGFEDVEGFECVRISSAVEGTLEGEGEQQGMPMTYEVKSSSFSVEKMTPNYRYMNRLHQSGSGQEFIF